MAKEQVKEAAKVEAPKTDFVKLVKEATQAHGASTFVRVNLSQEVSSEGLKMLNKEYSKEGVEVFSNGKSVVLLKS